MNGNGDHEGLISPDWAGLAASLNLPSRQKGVAEGLYNDHKPKRIALDLGISPHTVRTHKRALYARLGVSSNGGFIKRILCEHFALAVRRASGRVDGAAKANGNVT